MTFSGKSDISDEGDASAMVWCVRMEPAVEEKGKGRKLPKPLLRIKQIYKIPWERVVVRVKTCKSELEMQK